MTKRARPEPETEITPAEAASFEHKLAELEGLVEQLESGELELADALDRFRQGIELGRQCRSMLDEAQQLVDRLVSAEDPASDGSGERSG